MNDKMLRLQSVKELIKAFEMDPLHSKQVAKLALQLFDELAELHGMGEREREWLNAAALLHDIGWAQSEKAHHKSSMKLILKKRWQGWLEEEQLVVANVARYHRKAPPKPSHKKFAKLPPQLQRTVRKLAALLRLADGLDRSHSNVVDRITCQVSADSVAVTLICKRELYSELYGFDKKKHLFKETFGLPIIIAHVTNSWDMLPKVNVD